MVMVSYISMVLGRYYNTTVPREVLVSWSSADVTFVDADIVVSSSSSTLVSGGVVECTENLYGKICLCTSDPRQAGLHISRYICCDLKPHLHHRCVVCLYWCFSSNYCTNHSYIADKDIMCFLIYVVLPYLVITLIHNVHMLWSFTVVTSCGHSQFNVLWSFIMYTCCGH